MTSISSRLSRGSDRTLSWRSVLPRPPQVHPAIGPADGVVPGQRRHLGVLEESAQHQYGLLVRRQGAGAPVGARRVRSASSRPDRNRTLFSETSRTASYVILMAARDPYEE